MSGDARTETATLSEPEAERALLLEVSKTQGMLLHEEREELRKTREERNKWKRISEDLEVELANCRRLLREAHAWFTFLAWLACLVWIVVGASSVVGPWIAWLRGYRFPENTITGLSIVGIIMLVVSGIVAVVYVNDKRA